MASPANHLLSEFDNMYPKGYDPEFTADISTKMCVPDRLELVEHNVDNLMDQDFDRHTNNMRRSMNVPDRIMVSGQDEHLAMREDLRFHPDPTLITDRSSSLGLATPPRSLKLDENIYADNEDVERKAAMTAHQQVAPNGHVTFAGDGNPDLQLTPQSKPRPDLEALTTPGGGLLLQDSDDDEIIILKKQVIKLTRHVVNLQKENEQRSQRELFLYPVVLGYIIMQVAKWFMRNN